MKKMGTTAFFGFALIAAISSQAFAGSQWPRCGQIRLMHDRIVFAHGEWLSNVRAESPEVEKQLKESVGNSVCVEGSFDMDDNVVTITSVAPDPSGN